MRTMQNRTFVSFLVPVVLCISLLMLVSPSILSQNELNTTSKDPTSYRDVVKKVLPAIVSIESKSTVPATPAMMWQKNWPEPFELPMDLSKLFGSFAMPGKMPEMVRKGFGSGFIMDPTGLIITNHHVVQGAKQVMVHLQDGRTFESTDIKSDPKSDIAVIRISASSTLPHLEFADDSTVEIGDRVLAFGSPFGLTGSVTSGIVSGKGRNPHLSLYEDYLQTDAAINPGNSGGPLVNLDGKVIGVNAAIKSLSGGSQGVGFAIPCGFAKDIISKLLKNGTVQRGYLGVQIRALEPAVAERLGAENRTGVVISQVMDHSPASKAGMKAGDVITAVAGNSIKEPAELQRQIAALSPHKDVTLKIVRDGTSREITVTLEDQPDMEVLHKDASTDNQSDRAGEPIESIGIEISNLTEKLTRRYGYQSEIQDGAVITHVDSSSLAAQAGIVPGVILTKVDNTKVANADQARSALEKASLQRGILLQVQYPHHGVGYVLLKSK
ncbi:MAG TPA: Do family serine endopeptidase [Gemmatales bacterium]|nr:Do family serine endopeptidase [Gemmatales bacterium]